MAAVAAAAAALAAAACSIANLFNASILSMSIQLLLVKSGELAATDFMADALLDMPKKLAKGLFCIVADAVRGGVILVGSLTSGGDTGAETEANVEAAALAAAEG